MGLLAAGRRDAGPTDFRPHGTKVSLPVHLDSEARLDRPGVDAGGNRDVLDGDAERLEESDVLGVLAAGEAADDHLAELADVGPV